jgi:hypothetical protein
MLALTNVGGPCVTAGVTVSTIAVKVTERAYAVNREFRLSIYPLNAELNPICHLLALLGAHHILHVSRIRINCSTIVVR